MSDNQDDSKDLKSRVKEFLLAHPSAGLTYVKNTFPSEDPSSLKQILEELKPKKKITPEDIQKIKEEKMELFKNLKKLKKSMAGRKLERKRGHKT